MTDKRRVVVTGCGCVSPLGPDVGALWSGLLEGRSGIGPITRFDAAEFTTKIAAEVKDFDPTKWIAPREVRQMDRFIQFSIAAADEALRDAGLEIDEALAPRVGTVMGVGVGGLETIEVTHLLMKEKGPKRISPYFIPGMISNLAPGHISMRFGAKGPSVTTTSACASSAHAIGESYRMIQYGSADVVISGGAEATVTPLGIGGFNALKALSTRNDSPTTASRPFDKDRDGFVMGEGSGVLILEELEHAKRRGARIYAEVTGYGSTADANHITAPAPGGEGAVRCMHLCLADGRLRPEQVDYINAHGTSTPINDPLETLAVKTAFGEHARKVAISSTKSMTGHLLGAAGAIEAIVLAKAIEGQVVPPTMNLETPDPECDLDYVPNQARQVKVEHAISNSLGFGGTNVTLLLSRFRG